MSNKTNNILPLIIGFVLVAGTLYFIEQTILIQTINNNNASNSFAQIEEQLYDEENSGISVDINDNEVNVQLPIDDDGYSWYTSTSFIGSIYDGSNQTMTFTFNKEEYMSIVFELKTSSDSVVSISTYKITINGDAYTINEISVEN